MVVAKRMLVSEGGDPVDPAWLSSLAEQGGGDAKLELQAVAEELGVPLSSDKVAAALDARLQSLPSCQRSSFLVPKNKTIPGTDDKLAMPENDCIYLVGNSLGLQPKRTRELVSEELDKWAEL